MTWLSDVVFVPGSDSDLRYERTGNNYKLLDEKRTDLPFTRLPIGTSDFCLVRDVILCCDLHSNGLDYCCATKISRFECWRLELAAGNLTALTIRLDEHDNMFMTGGSAAPESAWLYK